MSAGSDPDVSHDTVAVAPRRATSAALTIGTVLAVACFAVAVAGDLARLEAGPVAGSWDIPAFVAALAALRPWAWAVLGTVVVLATPVIGLVITAVEFDAIDDRRGALMAGAVVAVLAISLLLSLLA